ncbi:aminotransferase class I/II-fold pyridoxal phosphate-dependent enzyme [Pendulispora brunnea]|uniref:Aminotransferase class I/II-fold pyridoxal phosphate-dependent enzyme n=1 Tax=Pendulispora brunnea TaxID=2905690 RepID=A0ABZ2KNI5_9BACT
MLDFTSALYLGMRHGARQLEAWSALTEGKPAALKEPPGARAVAARLAGLAGCQSGLLFPSTLHLFWDLFCARAADEPIAIHFDAGLYEVGRWGIQRAAAHGVPVHRFAHHDVRALAASLERTPRGRRPIVVTDGGCPRCGQVAPLRRYLERVRARGGYLVVDDTQALGLFGGGGGGSLRRLGIRGPEILWCASLAKGFGVPVAAVAGAAREIAHIEARSDTRVHTSPPSQAVISAAARALTVNSARGPALRSRLARNVQRFRAGLLRLGVRAPGSAYPQVNLPVAAPRKLHARLLRRGVRTVLFRGALGWLLTARHTAADIDEALRALAASLSAP